MKLTYHRCGDYLLPALTIPDESVTLGKYGRMRKTYLKEHKPILYNALLLSGKLTEHLIGVEAECRERLETLLPQMMRVEGVDEALKARDQMEWVVQNEQQPEPSRRNPAERTGLRLNHKVGVMQPLSRCCCQYTWLAIETKPMASPCGIAKRRAIHCVIECKQSFLVQIELFGAFKVAGACVSSRQGATYRAENRTQTARSGARSPSSQARRSQS